VRERGLGRSQTSELLHAIVRRAGPFWVSDDVGREEIAVTSRKHDPTSERMPLAQRPVETTPRGEPSLDLSDRRGRDRQGGWMEGKLWEAPDADEAWEETLDEIERKKIG
jgi:hypothetical protein